jgi:amino acid adenylation domain-containing protein
MDLSGDAASVHAALEAIAALQPEAAFLIDAEAGASITFQELRDHSLCLSRILMHAGLHPGDKVAFFMDNGLLTAQLFIGVMYGGFVAVPINVRAGAMQLSYMLDHCDAKVVFVENQYREMLSEALAGVRRDIRIIEASADGSLRDWDEALSIEPSQELEPAPAADDIALLMYSSGSTGKPKGALHTHSSILAHGRNSIRAHQLSAADRSLLVLPLYHINAECVTLIPTLLSGGSVVIAHRFAVNRFWDWIDDLHITWSALVPTIISELVNWDDPGKDRRQAAFQRVRFFRSSSAPLSPSLHQQFLDKFNLPLIQAMGSTEGGNVFSNPVPPGKNKLGSPGLPWGFEARIVDREGRDVPQGEPGEVLLRGPALMKCYYKDPEGTAAVVDNEGWLHTGDLARQDEEGYFFVIGRSKELIIKGGVNIAPRQIDEVLECHPAVLEAAAVGIPDRYFGEEAVAFVVLRQESATGERELLTFCETRLGHFKTPARIYFLKELPKGPSGKVQRLRLLDPEILSTVAVVNQPDQAVSLSGSGHAEGGSLQSAASIEQIIATAWAEVLNLPAVDTQTNFFALGGHSLIAIQCLSKLRAKLPVVLSLSEFFEHSTVAEQARFVRQQLHSTNAKSGEPLEESPNWEESLLKQYVPATQESIPHLDSTLPHPLSPSQQRVWFMEKLNPNVPVYNESDAVLLTGDIDVNALEKAFNVIVSRHEVLRSTIETIDGVPHAVIHPDYPLRFREIDLSRFAAAKRQSELDRLLIDEPRTPYSLETEPGIRISLIRLSSREHVLILSMHHLICDLSSEGIIWRELSVLYRSYFRGEQVDLPALPISHRDYAVWYQKRLEQTAFSEDLDFWEENLKNAPVLLAIPADRHRPATMSYQGKRLRRKLSSDLTEALRTTGRQEKTSLFTIFAAALDTVLYRYTGTEDILLGIPIADRDLPELQSTIGFLLHTQVLRTTLSGDITFRELLSRVQKATLDLYAHRAVPFDQVVRKLRPERNPSYSPIFQVMLNWIDRDQQLPFIGLEGLTIESLMAAADTSKFDLFFFIKDNGGQIWLELEYNTDIFDEDRISRLLDHYQTVLEAVATNPGNTVAKIPLLTSVEQDRLLHAWNETAAEYPAGKCVHQLIEEQAEKTPHAVAVVFEEDRLSYTELNQRANQLAHYLRELGVRPDDRVAICVERSLEMIVALLAVLKAGGAYVPLDPTYPVERLRFMLRDSEPVAVLTQAHLRDILVDLVDASRVIDMGDGRPWKNQPLTDPESAVAGLTTKNLAYVIYTSGSTGTPKGVMVEHGSLTNFVCSMQARSEIDSQSTLLAVTTITFDIAALEFYLPLTKGACVRIASREVAVDGIRLLQELRRGVTIMQATPATWRLLLAAGWQGEKKLTLLCGGEALSVELAEKLVKGSSAAWNMYGPTETTVWSLAWRLEAGLRRVSIGRPIANTRVYILDGHGAPVPVGVTGELYIGGAGVARGYLHRPELTAERFLADPFSSEPEARVYRTGDLARYLPDGNIEFLGRNDFQVKLRGFRIELGEIEARLEQQPKVRQCVVSVAGDNSSSQRLIAYVEPADRQIVPSVEELKNALKAQLPEYMVPAIFVILDSMPLTPNGKVDRKALTARAADAFARDGYEAPQGELETVLASVWAEALDLEQVGRQDNFFALGGHSLLVLKVVQEINNRFEADLRVAEFFQDPTIAAVSKVLMTGAKQQSRLVTVHPARSAGQIFFVDAAFAMIQLAAAFNPGPAIYATEVQADSAILKAAIENRVEDLPTMEDLARPRVNLILQEPANGPCVLIGHSFCGLLAFEMARQLWSVGREVTAVVLLDSMATLSFSYRLRNFTRSRAKSAFAWRLRDVMNQLSMGIGNKSSASSSQRLGAIATELEPYQGSLFSLPWEVHRRITGAALNGYRCRRSKGMGILVRAKGDPRYLHFKGMGWDGLFMDGLKMVDVEGDHLSLFADENVSVLAKAIQNSLSPLLTFEPSEVLAQVE